MNIQDWRNLGEFYDILGYQLFVIDTGESDKPTLVILHGYPTSSYDYHKVLPQLSKRFRVIVHDHLGFGFSDKPTKASYSLKDQATRALELWKQLGLQKVTLLAHDYGTSVATEIISRHNAGELAIEIEELILCNGSIHIEFSQLRTIQKLLRNKFTGPLVAKLTNYPIFRKNMRNIYFDSTKVTDSELEEMWFQLNYNQGKKVIHQLTQYITERYIYWNRWVGALKETQIPTKIIWAKNDPIAIPKIAETLASEIPNNKLIWMENTGHFLMLENPEEWLQLVLKKSTIESLIDLYLTQKQVYAVEEALKRLVALTTGNNYLNIVNMIIDYQKPATELDLSKYLVEIANPNYHDLLPIIQKKLNLFKDKDAIEDLEEAIKKIKNDSL